MGTRFRIVGGLLAFEGEVPANFVLVSLAGAFYGKSERVSGGSGRGEHIKEALDGFSGDVKLLGPSGDVDGD